VDVYEVVRYSSLYFTKELTHATKNMIFFVVMAMDIHMVVSQRQRLSPSLYKQYCNIANFKVDFHKAYVKEMKDSTST